MTEVMQPDLGCPYASCDAPSGFTSLVTACPSCHRRLHWCPELTCRTQNAALARYCRRCGRSLNSTSEWPAPRSDGGGAGVSNIGLDYDAIDAFDPPNLWQSRVAGGLGEVVAPPVCEHGVLAVCTNRGRLALINRFTGDLLAEVPLDGSGAEGEYSALIHKDVLVAAGNSSVHGFSLSRAFLSWDGGAFQVLPPLWKVNLQAMPVSRQLSLGQFIDREGNHGAAVVVVAGDGAKSLIHTIEVRTGRSLSSDPLEIPSSLSYAVSAEDGAAYFVGADRNIWRLDPTTLTVSSSRQPLKSEPNLDVGIAWHDGVLFFFDMDGALCVCQTYEDSSLSPMRASDHTLQVVKGFSVCTKGVLVSCSRGLAMITRNGRRLWIGESGMDAAACPPIIAGDVGFTVAQNRNILYYCDIRGTSPVYRSVPLPFPDAVIAPPVYADGLLYVTSVSGEISCFQVNPS